MVERPPPIIDNLRVILIDRALRVPGDSGNVSDNDDALVAEQKDNIFISSGLPNLLCPRLKSRYIEDNSRGLPPRFYNLAHTCLDVGYVPSCKY